MRDKFQLMIVYSVQESGYGDKCFVVKVTHVPMSKEEEDEREDALAEVMDSMYLLGRGDIDAEGEVEGEDIGVVKHDDGIAYENDAAIDAGTLEVFGD